MGESKKPLALGPAASSFALVCLLFITASNRKNTSDIKEVLGFLTLLALTGCTIWIWIRYLKEYVTFAIEQKLGQENKQTKD